MAEDWFFNFMEGAFPFFFFGIFALIVLVILSAVIGGIVLWNKNNKSPKLVVPAKVVSKRTKVSGGSGDSSSSTWYYVTFQVESGDRMELPVNGNDYGLMAEGDQGKLAFQGTRFQGFDRSA